MGRVRGMSVGQIADVRTDDVICVSGSQATSTLVEK